jgi:hypothetical protein
VVVVRQKILVRKKTHVLLVSFPQKNQERRKTSMKLSVRACNVNQVAKVVLNFNVRCHMNVIS